MITKRNIIMPLLLAASVMTQANPVTAGQALNKAKAFTTAGSNGARRIAAKTGGEMKIVYTEPNNLYYVASYGEGQGYVIVSGDDCASTILGYSTSGNFDYDKFPENKKAWLENYARQVAYAATTGNEGGDESQKVYPEIPQMLKTQWDQEAPYNNLLESYIDSKGDTQGVCTGCVATAMAQVINYHKWPETVRGMGQATMIRDSRTMQTDTLTLNMDGDVLDWNNMLDNYVDPKTQQTIGTDEQQQAVALLMRDCGYSVEMNYNGLGNGQSGASHSKVCKALVENFNYDLGTHTELADWYTTEQWDSLVYAELANGPIIFGGSASISVGGHEFVCDGYDGNGKFHMNWGWGGNSDDYFKLTALKPGKYNFSSRQGIVAGMRKPQEGSQSVDELALSMPITPVTADRTWLEVPLQNYSPRTVDYNVGLQITDKTTGKAETIPMMTRRMSNCASNRFGMFLDNLRLADGTYNLRPIYNNGDGNWKVCHKSNAFVSDVDMTVTNGKMEFSSSHTDFICIDAYTYTECLYNNTPDTLKISIWGNGGIYETNYKVSIIETGKGKTIFTQNFENESFSLCAPVVRLTVPLPAMEIKDGVKYNIVVRDLTNSEKVLIQSVIGKADDPSAVEGISKDTDGNETVTVFTMNGTSMGKFSNKSGINTLPAGMYIVKSSNGTVHKVAVK